MNRIARSLVPLLFALALAACNRREVTSVESPAESNDGGHRAAPSDNAGRSGGTAPGISAEETAAFEAWFRKYGLDPKAPATLDADNDSDGYSNREEFLAGTNPTDSNSMPGMIEGVSMKEIKDVRVPLILREVKGERARVEHMDATGQEELRVGSQPRGLSYRVTAIRKEEKADKHGVLTDVSQVTMENPDTKETVVLVRDLPARSSETHAVVVGPGGVEKKIRVDETVTLPGQGDKQFKVLELRPDQVVVEDLGSKKPFTIPKR